MKKRILLFVAIMVMLVCVFAISSSAAEPDSTKETVTLSDGTVCPIWDTDGDALIWYVSTANANDGYANYDYVKAQDARVSYEANGSYSAYGSSYNQTRYVKIDGTDGVSNIVVLNINDDDVVITSDKAKGGLVNGFEYTFNGSTVLEYAYLHSSTVAIQKQAFQNCAKLVYVNFDELVNLKQIESQAFWCSYNLFANETLDLSKTALCKIGQGGFAANATDSSKMMLYTKVILPSSLTDFGGYPFQYCLNLKTVEGLENLNVASLPEAMFYHCPSLEEITLPSTLTSVSNKMFGFRSKVNDLTTNFRITIPSSVKTVGEYVFQNNTALVEIEFAGTSLTKIGTASFENATRLTEIAFPEGLTYLGNCICKGASSLSKVTLPSTLTEMLDNSHFYNTALTEVIGLENTQLAYIPASAFRGLKNWTPDVIKLPNTVTKIGQYAFADVGMKSVILSANLEEFNGSEAFVNCKNLETVYVPSTITNFNSNTFKNNLRGDILFFVTSTDSTYLASVKDKFAGADIITLDTYLSDTATYAKGRHIVSGYNACEAFYNGVHELDPEKSNACAGICANCQEAKLSSNPVHDYVTTLVYANYLANGTKTQTCQ
ncbi:MAG: leucine-rich repeat domain-containing protein, partial [Clostridia bacterium]|nr:leucine-rich repeat domain-containing protein [Clostridia bacterium]